VETLERLKVRAEAAMLETRQMIADMLTMAQQARATARWHDDWSRRERQQMDAVAGDAKD
jgi:hypothetical protein